MEIRECFWYNGEGVSKNWRVHWECRCIVSKDKRMKKKWKIILGICFGICILLGFVMILCKDTILLVYDSKRDVIYENSNGEVVLEDIVNPSMTRKNLIYGVFREKQSYIGYYDLETDIKHVCIYVDDLEEELGEKITIKDIHSIQCISTEPLDITFVIDHKLYRYDEEAGANLLWEFSGVMSENPYYWVDSEKVLLLDELEILNDWKLWLLDIRTGQRTLVDNHVSAIMVAEEIVYGKKFYRGSWCEWELCFLSDDLKSIRKQVRSKYKSIGELICGDDNDIYIMASVDGTQETQREVYQYRNHFLPMRKIADISRGDKVLGSFKINSEKCTTNQQDIENELSIQDAYDILNSDKMQMLFEIGANRQELLDRKQQFNNTLDMVLEEYSGQLFPEDLIVECQNVLYEVCEKGADICDVDGAYVQWLNSYGAKEYILSLADICELFEDFKKENIIDIYEAYELISGFENCTSIFWMKQDSGEDTFLLCVDSGGSYGIYNIYLAELVNGNLVVRDSFEAQGEGLGRVIQVEQSYYYIYLQYNQNLKNYDGVKVHRLEQDAEYENILIRYIPKEFVVENLSVSDIDANEKIESYIQDIMVDLRKGKYLDAGNSEDWDCLMGDEVLEEQFPLTSEYEKYVKADMANIGIDVYFQKKIFIPSNTAFSAYYKTDFYLWDVMTDEVLKIDALEIKNKDKKQLVQLWSKKFDDLTYVFKIFHLENYEYALEVSLLNGNSTASIRTDVILPICRFELVEGNVEVY